MTRYMPVFNIGGSDAPVRFAVFASTPEGAMRRILHFLNRTGVDLCGERCPVVQPLTCVVPR